MWDILIAAAIGTAGLYLLTRDKNVLIAGAAATAALLVGMLL